MGRREVMTVHKGRVHGVYYSLALFRVVETVMGRKTVLERVQDARDKILLDKEFL